MQHAAVGTERFHLVLRTDPAKCRVANGFFVQMALHVLVVSLELIAKCYDSSSWIERGVIGDERVDVGDELEPRLFFL